VGLGTKRSTREKFLPVSDQMKAWSSALAAEFQDWPQVTQKSFFGFTALYRGKRKFGLLPRTKSVFTPNAVAFRFNSLSRAVKSLLEKDSRVSAFDKHKTSWFIFELSSDSDLHDAFRLPRTRLRRRAQSQENKIDPCLL
jgi:hypothetical protein